MADDAQGQLDLHSQQCNANRKEHDEEIARLQQIIMGDGTALMPGMASRILTLETRNAELREEATWTRRALIGVLLGLAAKVLFDAQSPHLEIAPHK